MPGISLILGLGPTYAIQRVVSSAKRGSAGNEQLVHCPHSFPHPCDLPAVIPIATTTFTLSTPRRQTTPSHMTYLLVLHNRRPLTFLFPLFLTFRFSGRYLDFARPMSLSYLVRETIIFHFVIQVQEYCTVSRWDIICNVHGHHYDL